MQEESMVLFEQAARLKLSNQKIKQKIAKGLGIKSYDIWKSNFPKRVTKSQKVIAYCQFNLDNRLIGKFRIVRPKPLSIEVSIFPMKMALVREK